MTPPSSPGRSARRAGAGSNAGVGSGSDAGAGSGSDARAGAASNGKQPLDVTITEVETVTPELVAAFARLLPQLSSSSPPPDEAELAEIVRSQSSVLFVARDPARGIVGSLTLALFRVPTGVRAWIEDVVVDGERRGAGIGEALVAAAIDRAVAEGAKSVDLTSRPSREDANRLYQRMGFEARATNVYRWSP